MCCCVVGDVAMAVVVLLGGGGGHVLLRVGACWHGDGRRCCWHGAFVVVVVGQRALRPQAEELAALAQKWVAKRSDWLGALR
mmetsp:Transcript_70599/g.142158  ORF Transcript_70599/g.142158 Transcript_70599/m.142158 type:complete len:82 (-) Transcript_70599:232-477(-)